MDTPLEKIIIKTNQGYEKINFKRIKYINIEGRHIAYHLTDGKIIYSQCLRTSFKHAVGNIINYKFYLFLPPSLIVNLQMVKQVNKNYIVFNDNEIYYIPKCKYDTLYNAWINI